MRAVTQAVLWIRPRALVGSKTQQQRCFCMQKSISKKEGELLKIQRSLERQEQRIQQASEHVDKLDLEREVLYGKQELEGRQEKLVFYWQQIKIWHEKEETHRATLEELK